MTNRHGGRISRQQIDLPPTPTSDGDVDVPPAIEGLSKLEIAEWDSLCRAVPAGYFKPVSLPLLAQLCRHLAAAKHLARLIHHERGFSEKYVRLIREHRSETSSIIACMRNLKLTVLSNYGRDHGSVPEPTPKPWLS